MADPVAFEQTVRTSLRLLGGARRPITLLALHGLNSPAMVSWALREGGCCDVLDRLREEEGLFKLVGFSSHADTQVRTAASSVLHQLPPPPPQPPPPPR